MSGIRVALLALAFLSGAAGAETLYSVSRLDDQLRTIDPSTGDSKTSKTITLEVDGKPITVVGLWGLAAKPESATELWAVVDVGNETARRLATIDISGCSSTQCPAVDRGDLGDRFEAIAADCHGALFGITGTKGTGPQPEIAEALYAGLEGCSPSSCAPAFVVSLDAGDLGQALAFRGTRLFHLAGSAAKVFEFLWPAAPLPHDIALSGSELGQVSALGFWPTLDTFLAAGMDHLYRLSPSGSVTGDVELDHFTNGLAFVGVTCWQLPFLDGFETGNTLEWSSSVPGS